MREVLDRRALGAIAFVNAVTGARVRDPLTVAGDGLTLVRNGSGLYVVRDANGLSAHTHEFAKAPTTPAAESLSFSLTVEDPQRRYLPRMATIKLPRKDAPSSDPMSALRPMAIALCPAAALPLGAAWAVLRLRVQVEHTDVGVAHALVTLAPQLSGVEAVSALTDSHGEALVAVPGVAPVLPSGGDGDGGAVLTREFDAEVRAVLDRRAVRREDAPKPWPIPDPDEIERRRAAAEDDVQTVAGPVVQLAAGSTRRLVIEVALL